MALLLLDNPSGSSYLLLDLFPPLGQFVKRRIIYLSLRLRASLHSCAKTGPVFPHIFPLCANMRTHMRASIWDEGDNSHDGVVVLSKFDRCHWHSSLILHIQDEFEEPTNLYDGSEVLVEICFWQTCWHSPRLSSKFQHNLSNVGEHIHCLVPPQAKMEHLSNFPLPVSPTNFHVVCSALI